MTKRKLILAIIIEAICIPIAIFGWHLDKQGSTTTSVMLFLIPMLFAIAVFVGCTKAFFYDIADKIQNWLNKK